MNPIPCVPPANRESRQQVATFLFSISSLLGMEAALAASPPPLADQGWPREITNNKVKISCYQPQIDEWKNYRTLEARFAVTITPPGEAPALGVAEITGETTTDNDTRTVIIRNPKIVSARFQTDKPEDVTRLEALLKQNFPTAPLTASLDRIP